MTFHTKVHDFLFDNFFLFSVQKDYFEKEGVKEYFYPVARVEFIVKQGHYHIPLLLSPFSFSTYRGS